MKKALIVGIDDYKDYPLNGCVNDAIAVSDAISTNADESPNFSNILLTSDTSPVTTEVLNDSIHELFSGDASIALLYFAGHGIINGDTNSGYLVSQNGTRGSWGVSLAEILNLANKAHPRIKSSVIILDSCHSGYAGEITGLQSNVSFIGQGVTILTACHREQTSCEVDGHGLFTSILLDGLSGGSADICGRITPAAIYSHIDQTLGPWEQRPIYKANVQTFVTLKTVAPKIPLATLRKLPAFFKNPTDILKLDPSFEPDRLNIPVELRDLPISEENIKIFKQLQLCNRHGLVIPVDAEHMYYAAINSTGCQLTPLGMHYRKLAEMRRI